MSSKRKSRPTPGQVSAQIVTAARKLFLDRGYAGVNTDDLAALSSVSKQTIYRHFVDKDQVVIAAIQSLIDEVDRQSHEEFDRLRASQDIEHDLRGFARKHITDVIQADVLTLRRRIIAEVDRFPDVARAWYEAGPGRGHRELSRCFAELSSRGLLRELDPEIAAEQFNWLVLSIPLNRAMFGLALTYEQKTLHHYADAAVDVFLSAYGSLTVAPP